jgi:hypothetical protein
MKNLKFLLRTAAIGTIFSAALAQAASVSGTITDKTTGKPAVGDTVVLVDVQAGMGEVAKAVTDAKGHYTLNEPGASPYLVRVTHQGAGYFIGAPQNGGPGDISVYDVATKVPGVFIEADVIEAEADNGTLRINERIFVHNTSNPPTTQWSKKSFEIVLPADATVTEAQAQRPGGLPTTLKLDPDGGKGHYAYNFPIQPDDGDKDTLFQVAYTLPYSGGKYSFKSAVTLPADSFAVLLPKSMSFTAGAGADFKSVQADPGIQTYLLKKATPGKNIEYTISGSGSMPREDQGQQAGPSGAMGQEPAAGGQPGGGIGTPIAAPDPLSKYKWWILGGLGLLLVIAAAFLLRKPEGAAVAAGPASAPGAALPAAATIALASGAQKQTALLAALKEELFALESDKLSGTITAEEYTQVKAALEIVLKRALQHK